MKLFRVTSICLIFLQLQSLTAQAYQLVGTSSTTHVDDYYEGILLSVESSSKAPLTLYAGNQELVLLDLKPPERTFSPLCIPPCTVRLTRGVLHLAAVQHHKQKNHAVAKPMLLTDSTHLDVEYIDNSLIRNIGLFGSLGLFVSGLLLLSAAGPETETRQRDDVAAYTGLSATIAGALIFPLMFVSDGLRVKKTKRAK